MDLDQLPKNLEWTNWWKTLTQKLNNNTIKGWVLQHHEPLYSQKECKSSVKKMQNLLRNPKIYRISKRFTLPATSLMPIVYKSHRSPSDPPNFASFSLKTKFKLWDFVHLQIVNSMHRRSLMKQKRASDISYVQVLCNFALMIHCWLSNMEKLEND